MTVYLLIPEMPSELKEQMLRRHKFINGELASTVSLAKGMVDLRRQIPNRIIFFIFDLSPNCSSLSPVDLLI